MIRLKPTDKFLITLSLPDGETDKGVRAKIFNDVGVDVTPIPGYVLLTHVTGGLYMNAASTLEMPEGHYVVFATVYADTDFEDLDADYGSSEEIYIVAADLNSQDIIDAVESVSDLADELNDTAKMLKQVDFEADFSIETDHN